ncbi:MAG: HAMP domain-containing protein, partial [Clostridia bacterium]|nr:HAMP domain-containing protein [Clostridia bacterium]
MNETQDGLLREAGNINEIVVQNYIDVDKRPAAREELFVIARRYDAYIQLFFDDEELGQRNFLAEDSGTRWARAEEAELTEYIEQVKSGSFKELRYGLLSKYTGFETLTVMRPITNEDDNSLGVMFFHYDMTRVNRSIRDVFAGVATIAAIALILAVPLVMLLVRSITRPITHLNDVVKDYTKGNFARRAELTGKDEVAKLGRSFDAMADQLNTLEAARRSFVANVSHELRSPLTSMRGFLEAMTDGTIPQEDWPGYIDIVLEENRRMTVMVNDLLDLARIESGQYKLNPEAFDVTELIRRTVITFEARIAAKELNVDIDLPEDPVYVEADPTRIAQVLHNLVDNAVKYTGDGGSISISCSAERHIVTVKVADNGCGIPKEDLPHIFDRFYKAEKAHTPDGVSGTGLGLSIAKIIMDEHEQQLTVGSDEHGTVFAFT